MISSMLGVISKNLPSVNNLRSPLFTIVRNSSKKPKGRTNRGTIKYRNLISSSCESLADRGFLRSFKSYDPPQNAKETVLAICDKVFGGAIDKEAPLSLNDKFTLLYSCIEELHYSPPNSQLHKLQTVTDVITFYETPVSTTVPYDDLLSKELPPNLHIQQHALRFNPETDTKFKGVSAFPRSSTIVTGIKYKEKYFSVKSKTPYMDAEVVYEDPNKYK